MIHLVHADSHDLSLWPKTDKTTILLTDPPYGIKTSWKKAWHGNNGKSTLRDGTIPEWDHCTVDQGLIDALVKWADIAIIWGGNFYRLGPTPVWFVWDKLQSNRGSDAELAWTNAPIKGVKVFRMSRIDAYFNKRRFPKKHLAEKPVQLMAWCLEQLQTTDALVFDPFVGCGASIIAASEQGFDSVGIDINNENILECHRRVETLKPKSETVKPKEGK